MINFSQKEGFKCQEGSIEGTSFPQKEEDAQICPLPPSQNTQASKGTKISPQISCKALQVSVYWYFSNIFKWSLKCKWTITNKQLCYKNII